ncbi:MAG: hypothetical protein CL693_00240 [Cellvibrionaceae bacterium]|nr:hypothetical protein [Cellvibrionaceae bacterium]|tara:strand:+ start:901 stop:1896 length:996 start_codon:yes stop_codon:yes gene_type:complete
MNTPLADQGFELKPIPAILFLNNKGGVAKTTDSSLTAENLCLTKGKRVLLIDFDGQMNLTMYWVGVDHNEDDELIPPRHPDYDPSDEYDQEHLTERSNICDIFHGRQVLPHSTFLGPDDPEDITSPRVDIVAGSREGMRDILQNLNKSGLTDKSTGQVLETTNAGKLISQLGKFCSNPALAEQYDVIIIDSGPTETPLFSAAIQAATHVISPYKPEEFSIMGTSTLINAIRKARLNRIGREEEINFLGLLPCLVDLGRDGSHEETITQVRNDFAGDHFPEGMMITNTTAISSRQKKTSKKPDSVFSLPPSHKVRKRCDPVFQHIHDEVFSL